jgi:hypothetical protein
LVTLSLAGGAGESMSQVSQVHCRKVFEKHKQLDLLNTKTGEINLTHAPDEIRFEVEQFNKRVVTTEFNRVVAEELANHIDPSAPGAGRRSSSRRPMPTRTL